MQKSVKTELYSLLFVYLFLGVYFIGSLQANERAKFELGRMLFFDKILSGNRNISCAACHNPRLGSSDGLSLGVGEGGQGEGVRRTTGRGAYQVHERVPRNSPALFNLGREEIFAQLFHDGRLHFAAGFPSGIKSPAGQDLPKGLEGLLAAQALFPVQSATEMAGQFGENAIANAASKGHLAGPGGVWDLISKRLGNIPFYVELFKQAYPTEVKDAADIKAKNWANAIGFFEARAFQSLRSRFDYYNRDPKKYPLSREELRGKDLFFGKARCVQCHSGFLFTDNKFYSLGLPPVGAGKGDGYLQHDDFGFERLTGRKQDRYRFRTPSLRNLSFTAPYGHNGAYKSLYAMIYHHINPLDSLKRYQIKHHVLLPYRADFFRTDQLVLRHGPTLTAIANSVDIAPIEGLSKQNIFELIAFLKTLDEVNYTKKYLRLIPTRVPSGLSVKH
jgi:cytochrome c peroxidase